MKTTSRMEFNCAINNTYYVYQRYYLQGLHNVLGKHFSYSLPLYDSVFKIIGKVLQRLNANTYFGFMKDGYTDFNTHVGQYRVMSEGKVIRIAIDAHDNWAIRSPDILKWCDVYFKANKWTNKKYSLKVYPLVNGNGILSYENINYLRSLRNKKKEYDLSFIVRIWGGREHNIRLLESLSQLQGNNKLLAIFLKQDCRMFPAETESFIRRLEKAKVTWTFNNMSTKGLWDLIAKSKLSVIRLGKHLCIPWRMLDLLCLGSCVVFDSIPFAKWPVPLVEGKNYVSMGINRPEDAGPAGWEEYHKIPQIISKLIDDKDKQRFIAKSNLDYYEQFAAPEKVADYIFGEIQSHLTT